MITMTIVTDVSHIQSVVSRTRPYTGAYNFQSISALRQIAKGLVNELETTQSGRGYNDALKHGYTKLNISVIIISLEHK